MSVSSVSDSSSISTYSSSITGSNSLGEEDFLTLLVAQLENQDPLDPQDNTEFIAQLAQFSSLEAQTSTNDKLDTLIAAQSSSERSEAYSLLGQEVIVASDSFYLQGEDLEIGLNLAQSATAANLNIVDDDGKTVASFSLNNLQEGNNFVPWDGCNSAGEPLAKGTYHLDIEAYNSAGQTLDSQSMIKVRVDEVELDSSGSILVTDAGDIPISGVSSVVSL
ncbi:flagellar basal-body rod modification protein FlgD [Desulfuromusa kysingii]|uniref:Basal-body rod modification protein FlgD n=1 Tax=Desulfuromusa kysingii TaxID=37625 RepID=A0A1H3VYH8_9BACT|nr:flagellar hook capping FlgD N-terminal domain-containing protein [Desulfuromusa kysingii]SDZ79935.1 flagellar basal-body rod modification protein FlgD [Desulfuromusa kysingii]